HLKPATGNTQRSTALAKAMSLGVSVAGDKTIIIIGQDILLIIINFMKAKLPNHFQTIVLG
ncbi:MAG: hypothetical protein ABIH63_04805, partial [archaeon]